MQGFIGRGQAAIALAGLFLLCGCGEDSAPSSEPEPETGVITRGGDLTVDETWSGEVLITEMLWVSAGVTLTILPGTHVRFKHYRGYEDPNQYVGMFVDGGSIKAVGTPEEQIWFTSDAEVPINGDWGGIEIRESAASEFKYVIVEFAQLGIQQFDSAIPITHSIVRWVNAEGFYAERSSPRIEYCCLYENGYHDIALEQFNQGAQIRFNVFDGGHVPIMVMDSQAHIEGNYFHDYAEPAIYVTGHASANVVGNLFEDYAEGEAIQVIIAPAVASESANDYGGGRVAIPELDYSIPRDYELGYTPGDPNDQFNYVFAVEDETRRVVKRIGEGLGFGWALEFADGYLWKLVTDELVRIDPETGASTSYVVDSELISGPRGLTHDGEHFWVNDASLQTIVKFQVSANAVEVLDSFSIPDPEEGSRAGLASDGQYLYLRSGSTQALYQLDKLGNVVSTIPLAGLDVSSAIVWTGDCFWANEGPILRRFDKTGTALGWIYSVAAGTWGMAWDGEYLWTLQNTCERWQDAKIFEIEIKDDTQPLPW